MMTESAVVCPHQALVEVYFNSDGEVVIHQEGSSSDGSDDQYVVMTRENARRLVTHLQTVIERGPHE